MQSLSLAQICTFPFLAKYNNAAGYIGFVNLAFCLSLAVAYFAQKDYRRALYFFFAFCITATVIL